MVRDLSDPSIPKDKVALLSTKSRIGLYFKLQLEVV